MFYNSATLSTGAGALSVTGTSRARGDDARFGIWFYNNTTNIYSTSGDITLTGISGQGAAGGNWYAISAGPYPGGGGYSGVAGTANIGWAGGRVRRLQGISSYKLRTVAIMLVCIYLICLLRPMVVL